MRNEKLLAEIDELEKPLREYAAAQSGTFQDVVGRLRNAWGNPLRETAQRYNSKVWELQNGS